MRTRAWTLVVTMLAACGDEGASSTPDAAPEVDAAPLGPTYPPDQPILGRTLGEWGAAWWQFIFAIPYDENPARGHDCALHQSGDVFFLAGNFGGTDVRTCTVPAGKSIFFPVLANVCWPDVNPSCYAPSDAELQACARELLGAHAVTMFMELDGVPLEPLDEYHAESPRFSWTAPPSSADWVIPEIGPIPPNTCGVPPGDAYGFTDGVWIFLRPLAPGAHTIHFGGTVQQSPPFALDLTYQITQE
jgi:hypothetical protein